MEREARARALEATLRPLGHDVSVASERQDALEVVRTRRLDVALVAAEPEPVLIEELRQLAPGLPIIAVGAEDSALAAARALARGALGYVVQGEGGALSAPMTEVLTALVQRAGARVRVEADRLAVLEETRRVRKFYGDVLTSVGEGIVVIDEQGKIRFRNPEAARILGEEEAAPVLEEEPVAGQGAVPVLQMLVETLAEGQTRRDMIALEAEDQQKVFLDVTTSVLRSAEGRPSGAVAIVADRSSEKHLEAQLVHQERLATLGSLLASIAHEINNTLTSVTGCAEMGLELAQGAEQAAAKAQDPKTRAALEELANEIRMIFDIVLQSGINCQTIADNMLQYSRQAKPSHRVEQDLNKVIKNTLDVLGKHLGVEKVDLTLDLDPSGPRARIEPAKLQQALVNLIVNAVHALLEMPEEHPKQLRVETRRDTNAHQVTIAIRDNGPGIPPKRLERIFQPFFTTKGHGTGLGLHITRKVIEDLGGSISVESAVGVGTCFAVHLPLS